MEEQLTKCKQKNFELAAQLSRKHGELAKAHEQLAAALSRIQISSAAAVVEKQEDIQDNHGAVMPAALGQALLYNDMHASVIGWAMYAPKEGTPGSPASSPVHVSPRVRVAISRRRQRDCRMYIYVGMAPLSAPRAFPEAKYNREEFGLAPHHMANIYSVYLILQASMDGSVV